MTQAPTVVRHLSVRDIRFPTSLEADGSDAVHTDPDYSCAYVVLYTDSQHEGYGLSFTIGRGTEILVQAIKSFAPLVVGQKLSDIYGNFGAFWKKLTNESQLRWLGPEKGVVHLAAGAIINALWDLWAKIETKPLWKLLVDMDPERLVSTLDFTYVTDAITKEEVLKILRSKESGKVERERQLMETGYPAYTTHAGWLGYSTEKVKRRCNESMSHGFTGFKIKVGADIEDDKRRLADVRETIGWNNTIMVDANQRWDVPQAITWMKELAPFRPLWIEEPTSCDDVQGHAEIAKALNPLGIGVATGEHCHNRVMFKQFLKSGAMQFCQIDACRMGGVNEVLLVLFLAAKLKIPVCPHAGGVGLCELVQHYMMFDYICVTGTQENRCIEYVDHLHEHFKFPVVIRNAHYIPPQGNVSLTESVEDCRATERVCCMANEKRCALCNREYNAVAGGYHYCAKMHSLEENLHTATVYVDVGGSPEPMEIVTGSGFTTTWWAFSSIIAGVTLAAIAVVCRYRSRSVRATSHEAPGPSTRVLLSKESPQLSGHISVFYHDDGAVHRDCVVRLADVLWHFLQRPVVVVDDRHRGTVAEIGMAEWISRTLDGTGNTVVFVASEGAYRQIRNHGNHVTEKVPLVGDGNANDAFLLAWRTIVCNQRLAQNYSRVFNVRFQYTNVTHLTPDIVQRRSFCLPRDFAELSFHLLGCNEEAQRRSNVIRQALTTSRSFAELADAIWRVTGAPDDEARWIRPGL